MVLRNLKTQLSIVLYFFSLLSHLPFHHSLSFNFSGFKNTDKLDFSGNAFPVNEALPLTHNNWNSTGRVVYSEELLLQDPISGKFADFTTKFSFNISSLSDQDGAEGFAFFLQKNGSLLPSNAEGGCLALISNCSDFQTPKNPIFAVEFDSYKNTWDASGNHVGINVNSIQSTKLVDLSEVLLGKTRINVTISYDSQKAKLKVFLDYPPNPIVQANDTIFFDINLTKILPHQSVSVGFTSSTAVFRSAVHNIFSWEFESEFAQDIGSGKKDVNVGLVIGCVAGGIFVSVCGILFILIFLKKRNRTKQTEKAKTDHKISMDQELQNDVGPKSFSYNELLQATSNFSNERKLGEGGFGGVYKGFLNDMNRTTIAVKRVSKRSNQGRKLYISEVKIISRLRHRNLVKLLGWCHEHDEFLQVYEFMPNGSLDFHLFKGRSMLSWETRYKIILGLASALYYLHEESEESVVHRDIKTSNVMLDSDFNTKLGDFGLAKLLEEGAGQLTTERAGTLGYMAPEYLRTGKANKGSDVYSFGVVALEIACGRRSVEPNFEEDEISLVEWVWGSYGNDKVLETADKRLGSELETKEMERLLIVGLWCAHPDANQRPSIRQALQVLHFEAPLPNLAKKLPVPIFPVYSDSDGREASGSSEGVGSGSKPLQHSGEVMSYASYNVGR
ncbi:L-type lectin-domain containing receptor kinase IX.1 [Ziziphus jujuba]|uniref:L-type lectin-domain containing receptor kinase IX.1 n=1 Tax=Ziziphus jujuba TaxID=326968 RepID=A0A6P4AU05_ZIZJJ|nr:L-type lectin-domain containing receptor kinase IX.1 [Ziziphus jujuba]